MSSCGKLGCLQKLHFKSLLAILLYPWFRKELHKCTKEAKSLNVAVNKRFIKEISSGAPS